MIIEKLIQSPDINEWAFATLSREEYLDFTSACDMNAKLWASYQTLGLITEKIDITETVFSNILQDQIDVVIGEKIVLSEGTTPNDLQLYPRYGYWVERYLQATGLTEKIEIIP